MTPEEIKRLIYSRIDSLPALPGVIPRLLSQLEDRNTTATEVARTISVDPSLTADILKVANSAYYGFSGTISSLEHAITLLGFNMVRSLALSAGVIKILHIEHPLFSGHEFWVHSLRVATSMSEISRAIRNGLSGEEHIFIIGLLHDIGKILFAQFAEDTYRAVLERSAGEDVYHVERELLGMDHGEAGGVLLRRWLFPDVIYLPIHYHHHTDVPEGVDKDMLSLLSLSDKIAISMGNTDNPPSPENCMGEIEALGLSDSILEVTTSHLRKSEGAINAFCSTLLN